MFARLVSRGSSIAGALPRRVGNLAPKSPLSSLSKKPTVAYHGCSKAPAVLRLNPYVNTQPTRCFVTSIPASYSESPSSNQNIPEDLNPIRWGYDKAFVTQLAEVIKSEVMSLDSETVKVLNRTGIDGMSLGALNPPAWYGLMLVGQLTRAMLASELDVSKIPNGDGFELSPGEGGIPPIESFFEGQDELLRDSDGMPLIMYNKELFLPTMFQYASGQFFKDFDQKFKAELKGGQNAKDAIGGRLPMKKNEEWVATLRNIISGIDVPSPNQIRSVQSVEELILWRIFMESFTEIKPDVKVSTAYNVVARALAVVRAEAGLNVAGGRDGRTGGTAATSFNYRNNTVIDGLTAIRAIREAMDELGLDTNIAFSNNIYTYQDLVEALMVADRARIATIALVLLENCRFAKVCHKAKEEGGCPVNITVAPERFTPDRLIENVPTFFEFFKNAGQLSRQLGVPTHRRSTQLELSRVFKPNPKYPDAQFANWMAYQTTAKGQAVQKERPVQKPSPTESITQRDQEYQATFEVLEGGRKSVSLDGAPGAIGFFSSLQKESEKYLGVKFKVTHGGTYYGGGNNGLDLYAETVGDFSGNKQLKGSITALNSGRQFGMGSPGGTLVTAHTGTELGYRMGASTIVCETTHDAPFHYMGVGIGIVLGQAHDYPIDLLDNHDAPVNRKVSVGHNPFAAIAGGTVYLPKTEYERIIESGLMLKETFYRIQKKEMDASDSDLLIEQLTTYNDKLSYITKSDRHIAVGLVGALKSGVDPNDLFVCIETSRDMSQICPSVLSDHAQCVSNPDGLN